MKRVAINGLGRIGRLALRAAWERHDLDVVAVNEPHADATTMALLIEFDSVQKRWSHACSVDGDDLCIDSATRLRFTREATLDTLDWSELDIDIVLECSGQFRTRDTVIPHLERGARRVVVSAPIKHDVPNIVVGVNHDAFDLATEPIVTAASCTTNCLTPIVKVIHDAVGIRRGLVTTIHDPTNTQRVHDAAHSDPRRARAAQLNLIPTSTNSATAVTMIIPELAGRLDSIAVRAPVLNASLTDAVFHVARSTSGKEINDIIAIAASASPLANILGIETRPLVSSDYAGDPRSAVVDALSTRVTDGELVKVMAWYDNEWGYANRLVELAGMVAAKMPIYQ